MFHLFLRNHIRKHLCVAIWVNFHTVILIIAMRKSILLLHSTAENKILPSQYLVNSTLYFNILFQSIEFYTRFRHLIGIKSSNWSIWHSYFSLWKLPHNQPFLFQDYQYLLYTYTSKMKKRKWIIYKIIYSHSAPK